MPAKPGPHFASTLVVVKHGIQGFFPPTPSSIAWLSPPQGMPPGKRGLGGCFLWRPAPRAQESWPFVGGHRQKATNSHQEDCTAAPRPACPPRRRQRRTSRRAPRARTSARQARIASWSGAWRGPRAPWHALQRLPTSTASTTKRRLARPSTKKIRESRQNSRVMGTGVLDRDRRGKHPEKVVAAGRATKKTAAAKTLARRRELSPDKRVRTKKGPQEQ